MTVPVECMSCGETDRVESARDAGPEGSWACPECGWGVARARTDLLGP